MSLETQRQELQVLDEIIARRMSRAHFKDYIRYTKPDYISTWFNELICDTLEGLEGDIVNQKDARILVRMPPRAGKTEMISRRFPAWLLGRHPELEIIGSSYNTDLAKANGSDAKNISESTENLNIFPNFRISHSTRSKNRWRTLLDNDKEGGGLKSAGCGAGITGSGAHLFIIDDPYKDHEEAWSENHRKKIWDWYTTAAYTRLAPGGAIIMLLTSWHDAGLDNQVLEQFKKDGGPPWTVIDIPAIMTADYVGRHPMDKRNIGESYWPERWPLTRLEATKKLLGTYKWSALYQQRAEPEGGTIIQRHWLKYWQKRPLNIGETVVSGDLAFKSSKVSSRVSFQVWGLSLQKQYVLLDFICEPMEFTKCLHVFDKMMRKWPKATPLIEDKANGPALQSVMQRKYPKMKMIPVTTDKDNRFRAVAPAFERGDVLVPDPVAFPEYEEVYSEWTKFPNSEFNDNVDTASQAISHWEVPANGLPRFVGYED
jgi:predicted phage terminase large subunit-like protein